MFSVLRMQGSGINVYKWICGGKLIASQLENDTPLSKLDAN